MTRTNKRFCFPSFSLVVFWMASFSVLSNTSAEGTEPRSFLQEIESLEDEIFLLNEPVIN